ncbi:hypothetical protein PsorP6_002501 [Peronosclerospora sorghi]|uniref:Uncharacterized protein n=1 Tax=Peronosclerospora sorghi TaxID=230839 RepID=A0ACC0WYR6_9STRA|nr:hypothetical protein PsorP6_002501 [Peronosclerospora sorghi]
MQPRRNREERAIRQTMVRRAISTAVCAPLSAVIVTFVRETCALFGLLFVEYCKHSKDHGHARIQLYTHDALRNSVADILKVHGFPLHETAYADHSVPFL